LSFPLNAFVLNCAEGEAL